MFFDDLDGDSRDLGGPLGQHRRRLGPGRLIHQVAGQAHPFGNDGGTLDVGGGPVGRLEQHQPLVDPLLRLRSIIVERIRPEQIAEGDGFGSALHIELMQRGCHLGMAAGGPAQIPCRPPDRFRIDVVAEPQE